MSDDRFKDAGEFEPEKAWSNIRKTDSDRSFDAKHPLSRWDRFWIPASLTLLALAIGGCAVYLLLWAFSAPFA